MKNVLKTTATAAVTALAIGGFSLAAMSPAIATGTASPAPSDTVKKQVGAYVYEMLRPQEQAAWGNSGKQRLLTVVDGTEWISDDTIVGKLPADVCGAGWAIQQDKLDITGTFTWPMTITYPEQFKDGGDLQDSTHKKLEEYGEVPDCGMSPAPPGQPATPSTPTTPETPPITTPEAPTTPGTPPETTPEAPTTPGTPPGTSTPPTSTTPAPTPTLGTDITVAPSGTTTTPPAAPPAAASAQLAQTGANAPVMASLAGAGVLAVGLGAAALVRSRRGAASSDA